MATVPGYTNTENFMLTILAILMIIIFGGAIYAFIMSIFQFVFSKGDPEKVKKAWNNIRYMILGIIFTIFLLFFFPILFERFRMPGYKIYTARNIFNKSSMLLRIMINPSGNKTQQYYYQPQTQNNTNYDLEL